MSLQNAEASAAAPFKRLTIYWLLAVFACVFLGNLGGWDLWNPDEPRYAQIAREMMETGQYLVPHLNAEAYPDKPPLFFWLIALASKPFGDVTAFSARLPVALAALGLVFLTFLFGKKLWDSFAGILAAVILFTSEEFFTIAISAHFDIILALWTTLSLYFFYCGYEKPEGDTKWYLLSYICMGRALLTKGPVGVLLPLVAVVLFLGAKKELKKIKGIHLGKGLLLAAGMLAAWLAPACVAGGEAYMQNILFQQTFGRMIDSYSHKGPFYYYLIEFPVDFFPWSLFIPSAAVYFWKKRAALPGILFPAVWFGGTFLFFSAVSCKRSLYLLPLYPAAALFMAKFWSDAVRDEQSGGRPAQSKLFTIPFSLFCFLLIATAAAGIVVFSGNFKFIAPVRNFTGAFYPTTGVLLAGGILGVRLIKRRGGMTSLFWCVSGTVIAVFITIVFFAFPAFNNIKSAKPFCEKIKNIVGPGDKLVATFKPATFNYFLHRYPIPVTQDTQELIKIFKLPHTIYALVKVRHHENVPEEIMGSTTVLAEQRIGHRRYSLIVNRAPEEVTPEK